MKPILYIETTIISYLAARTSRNPIVAGRQALTREWWENRRMAFDLVVSELVFNECAAGDQEAAKRRLDYIADMDSLHVVDSHIKCTAFV
jgi:hypothetical protein